MHDQGGTHAVADQEARVEKIYGAKSLRQLRQPSAAVVGNGLLGGIVALQLGYLSVPLLLVDPDTVAPENVGCQGFRCDQVGHPKVEARAEQILECSTRAKLHLLPSRVEDIGLGTFAQTRLIISAVDSRVVRIRIAEIAQKLGKPMLDLAVDGSGRRRLGTVALYDADPSDAPCYSCRQSSSSIAAIRTEGRGMGCPSWRNPGVPKTAPTLTAPAFGAVIGGLASTWAIDVLLGRAAPLFNTQIHLSADSETLLRNAAMRRSPRCALNHERLDPIRTVPAKISVGELAAQAMEDLGALPDTFQFSHRDFVPELHCPMDGQKRFLPRFAHGYSDDELVCGCDPGACFVPTRQSDRMDRNTWRRLSAMRWRELALPRSDVVSAVTRDGRSAHYIVGAPPRPRARAASRQLT